MESEHNVNAVASRSNQSMLAGDYLAAMRAYSEALDQSPDEYRLYVNRALCYMRLDYYYLALVDINEAIKLAECNAKCYFIRSKILKKLNQVEQAEQDLTIAARLAPNDADIDEEVRHFRENEKNEFLLKDKLKGHDLYEHEYFKVKLNLHLVQASKVPTNLWGYHAVRVENINDNGNTALLSSHFSLFGDIKHIRRCSRAAVVIDYGNPVVPMFTIAYFQGKVLPGLSATAIHPKRGGDVGGQHAEDKAQTLKLFFAPGEYQHGLKYARPKHPQLANKECYYWRTTSCTLKGRCNKLHIPANKNVDTQVWMTTP